MKRMTVCGAGSTLLATLVALSWAATNLNSSKSNIYRAIYDTAVVSPSQAAAVLAELDKVAPKRDVSEATLRGVLGKHGISADKIKRIILRKDGTIILLANPADEAQALAVSDPGASGPKKPTK